MAQLRERITKEQNLRVFPGFWET